MNLSQETWGTIVEGLQDKIQGLQQHNDDLYSQSDKALSDIVALKKDLADKANEVTLLKMQLRDYEKRDEIERFIGQMGRRYAPKTTPYMNLTWESWFYILYPSADEVEYHKAGKAKEAIQNLLRSHELGFDDNGVIFRQS